MANDENSAPAAAQAQAKVERVAEHGFLAADGSVVEEIEKAAQITYKDKATGESFAYNLAAQDPAVLLMFALFGARTRATNTASAARQKRGRDSGYTQSDVEYIKEVFAETIPGQWAVAGEGARGPTIDQAILIEAIVEHGGNTGQTVDQAMRDKIAAKVANDLSYRKGAYANVDVRKIYNRLAGKADSPVNLFALD